MSKGYVIVAQNNIDYDYRSFILIYEDNLSITNIVTKIRIIIADTLSYSNILNDDCNS